MKTLKQKHTQPFFLNGILLFLFCSLLVACSGSKKNKQSFYFISGSTQGTMYNIQYGYDEIDELQEQIDELLHDFDKSLSSYQSNSLISRINSNHHDIMVDKYFKAVFDKSFEISEKTNGAFDITIGALANAWGFGDGNKQEVNKIAADSLLLLTGYRKVKIVDGKVKKLLPGILLNVNAIAQGYSVDLVCELLEQKGCKNYLVEIGGELRAKGVNNKGSKWKIGIDKPIEQNAANNRSLQAILTVSNKAVATSGNYRQFYEVNGIKYSHTIDPRTGQPVRRKILSATIVANNCMEADAYATACMVMDIESSIQLVKQDTTIAGYFIFSDSTGNFKEWYSDELIDKIKQIDTTHH